MSRRSWIIVIVLMIIVITVAVLGYKHVIDSSITRPLIFAIVCGYIYYRVSGGKKKNEDTIIGIIDKDKDGTK